MITKAEEKSYKWRKSHKDRWEIRIKGHERIKKEKKKEK